MKRYLAYIFLMLSAAVLCLSCHREEDRLETAEEGIVLRLVSTTHVPTKAGMNGVKDGEADWNEDLIATVDLFFYPDGGTDNDCVLHKRETPNESDGDAVINTYTTDEFITGTLVPTSQNAFWVYAIVNYPGVIVEDESDLTGTSVNDLKGLALNCNFSAAANHKQESFVMDGITHVTSVNKTSRLVAKDQITLSRVASKITVQLDIATYIEVPRVRYEDDVPIHYNERWEPMTSGVQLYIENAVRNTTVAAQPVSNPIYFSYTGNRMTFTKSTDPNYADYPWLTDPTYVYPQRWEYASKESPNMEPTIKLVLPWKRISDPENDVKATQKQFYYKIIIPDDTREATQEQTFLRHFVRNNWYNFKISVGMLGSETDEAAVVTEGSYYILDWQDRDVVIKQASIGKARFLSIEPKEHVLSNVPDRDIMYTSSHPVALNTTKGGSVLDITATKIYYGDSGNGTTYGGGTIRTAAAGHPDYPQGQKYIEYNATQRAAMAKAGKTDWLWVEGDYVRFYHDIHNSYTDGQSYDTSPYIIRFNLYHADHNDDAVYKQSVKITQYPAIYIEKFENSDFAESGSTTTNIGNHKGYVYINNAQGTSTQWSYVRGLAGSNKNYNMYVINVTVLNEDSEYNIGDPRVGTIDNLGTTFANAPAKYGTTPRSLTYYYPTSTSTDDRNIISPRYRVASSYGVCNNAISASDARLRCAAYQEDGFPMGRWRVPTRAEVEFITTLSSRGIIPTLFNVSGNYWCATGAISPQSSGVLNDTNQTTSFVRCVYDEWYWGDDKVAKNTATWGDKQR